MKKYIAIITITLSMFLLTSCNKEINNEDVQVYDWPLGTSSPEDTITQIYAQKFADEVNKLSNGKMKIRVYNNSVLGGDRELLESCKNGDIPFVVQNTAPQVSFMQKLSIFDLPMLFDNIEEVREKLDDDKFYGLMEKVYKEGGYKLLGFTDQGFRIMTTNKKIETILDFKGQKIRTMENSNHIMFWKDLKTNPTPMSFSEVYIGLQQNTIDAQENPYEVVVSSKLYEQQKYLIETNHLPHIISLIVNDEFYDNLSAKEQNIINKAAEKAKKYSRIKSDERIEEKIDYLKNNKIEFINLSKNLKIQIRNSCSDVYKNIENQVGSELFNSYKEKI